MLYSVYTHTVLLLLSRSFMTKDFDCLRDQLVNRVSQGGLVERTLGVHADFLADAVYAPGYRSAPDTHSTHTLKFILISTTYRYHLWAYVITPRIWVTEIHVYT